MTKPLISIVLGSYNRLEFLKLTLDSIRQECEDLATEIIIVEGGSTDGSIEWLITQKDVVLILQHNRGEWNGKEVERKSWGYFMNYGFMAAKGKYICMVSDDCLIVPGAIKNGVAEFEKRLAAGEKIGVMPFFWRNWPDDKEYFIIRTIGNQMMLNHGLYLKEALIEVGYIDEETYFFYNGDADLCLRILQAGYSIVEAPDSYIEHYNHANVGVKKTNEEKVEKDWQAFIKRWEGIYYDPQSPDLGEWLKKNYEDPHHTAKQFEPFLPFMKRMKRKFFAST